MRHHETEIKLAVPNPRALKKRLKDLEFRPIRARHFETNVLYDFADRRLGRSGRLLRLRLAGGEGLLTFKGRTLGIRAYKVRREVETAVEESRSLEEIFHQLGLREIFRYEKYRTVFAERRRAKRAGAPLLVYDETPIGRYVELEGAKRWIDRVARRLGYDRRDYVLASYAALYLEHCRERGQKPGHMVFHK